MAILIDIKKKSRKVIYINDYLEKQSRKIKKIYNINKEITDYKREAAENAEKLRIKLGVIGGNHGKN